MRQGGTSLLRDPDPDRNPDRDRDPDPDRRAQDGGGRGGAYHEETTVD
jgi:hypothetical protein